MLTLSRLDIDTNVAARKTIGFLQEIIADADVEARSVECSVILLVSEPLS